MKLLSTAIALIFVLPLSAIADPDNIVTENSKSEVESTAIPVFLEQFYDYQSQKYTLLLGDDRGACSYRIDPTDVYEQKNTRFVTAVVSRGSRGTACSGYFAFQVLQADCESNVLYSVGRETNGDPRSRSWGRFEMSLFSLAEPPAEVICSLPLARGVR